MSGTRIARPRNKNNYYKFKEKRGNPKFVQGSRTIKCDQQCERNIINWTSRKKIYIHTHTYTHTHTEQPQNTEVVTDINKILNENNFELEFCSILKDQSYDMTQSKP